MCYAGRLWEVDGKSAARKSLPQLSGMIMGPAGSTVSVVSIYIHFALLHVRKHYFCHDGSKVCVFVYRVIQIVFV
jgi:hypothetical protein